VLVNWNKEDGWGRQGDRSSHRRPRDRHKPPAPGKSDSGEVSTWEASKQRSEKRRKRSRVTWYAGAALLAVLVLLALAPTLASAIAPGIIASKGSEAIAGRVTVEAVSLGWFGGQEVRTVRVFDDAGAQRGEITAKTDKGLLGLLLAGGNYGAVTLRGEVDLSTDSKGRSFLEHTIGLKPEPADAAPGGPGAASGPPRPAPPPPALPKGLRAALVLDGLGVTYGDRSAATPVDAVRLDQVQGRVELNADDPARADLTGQVQMKRAGAAIFADAGRVRLRAEVGDLLAPDGALRLDAMTIDADIALENLASELLDVLPAVAGRATPALGPVIAAKVRASGSSSDLAVTLEAGAESISAVAPLRVDLAKGSIRSAEPIRAGADLGRLSLLMPDRDALLGPEADAHVTEFPMLEITIEDLALPIPPANPADLRGAGLRLKAEIGRLAAAVRAPGDEARRAVGFEPAVFTLDAPDLAGAVSIRTGLDTTIDGARSGTLRVDLTADRLLDDAGAIRVGAAPSVRGEFKAEKLVLAAFQPLAMAAGFDLTGIIGQSADLSLAAAPEGDSGATNFTLSARADNASASGSLRLEGGVLRTTGEGVNARLESLSPLLVDALAGAGVNLTQARGATLKVSELSADLAAIGAGDLAAVRLVADAGLERLAGVLAASGETVEAGGFTLRAEAVPLRDGVRVSGGGALNLNGAEAGAIEADLRAAGLLDASGALTGGLPTEINGRLGAKGVRAAVLQPFLDGTGLVLADDIGPAVDLSLTAKATPAPDAAIPPTDLTLVLTSRHLNGSGAFRLAGDRVESTGDGLRLSLDNPATLLTRFAPLVEGASVTNQGALSVSLRGLSLPLDPATRTPDLPASAGALAVRLEQVIVGDTQNNTAFLDSLGTLVTLRPGQAPRVEIDGGVRGNASARGTIAGAFDLLNAFDPPAPDGALALRPVGSLTIDKFPMNFVRLVGATIPRQDGGAVPLYTFARQSLGDRVNASLTTAAQGDGSLSVALTAESDLHSMRSTALLRPAPAGAFELLAVDGEARAAVSERVARALLPVVAPPDYADLKVPSESTLAVTLKTDDKGTVTAKATLDPTTLDGLPVPDEAGALRRLEPVTVTMKSTLTAPVAMLGAPDAAHAVTLDASVEGFDAPKDGKRLLNLTANAGTTLRAARPTGSTRATVRLATERTDWVDALAGLNGLLGKAVGNTISLSADLAGVANEAGSFDAADAGVEIRTPRLKTVKPLKIKASKDAIDLAGPAEINWNISPAFFNAVFPTEPGKAAQLKIAKGVPITLKADEMHLPVGKPAATRARLGLAAPEIPLVFPDGTEYTYQGLDATLVTLDTPGAARLRATASSPDAPGAAAMTLDTTVKGLPDGSPEWTAQRLLLDGEFGLKEFPVRLLDAMAAGDGQLVELLGRSLAVDTRLKNLPARGGTLSFDAKSPQADSKLRATVKAHPADKNLLAVTLDEPMVTALHEFQYKMEGKKVAMLPIFGSITKSRQGNQPATVSLARLVAPVDGAIDKIIMEGTVDPGEVDYDFQRGLGALLKFAKQNQQGVLGRRLQPFKISMKDGVARFDELVVPVGEFAIQGKGAIDLVKQTEDIVIGVPAGAFADELLGSLPGALGGTLRQNVVVPVRRKGPLGRENKWEPDFQAVIKELFKPENILNDLLKDQLKDLGKPKP